MMNHIWKRSSIVLLAVLTTALYSCQISPTVEGTTGTAETTTATQSEAPTVQIPNTDTPQEEMNMNPNKPKLKNTANLMNPIPAKSDAEAEVLRENILNAVDQVSVTGTVYYISENGKDSNSGLSEDSAWKSLSKLKKSADKLKSGDAVLFERGGIYRGTVSCVSGVYYGAYGTGDKPCIYQSRANYAADKWTQVLPNIWVPVNSPIGDVGIMVFNHGEAVGDRKFSKDELTKNGDFLSDGGLLLYMDTDPSEKYTSIEMGTDSHIFMIGSEGHDITIDNITMKYGGAMGVQAGNGVKNIVIKNCEIGWLGGSVLAGYGNGQTRYGNGVEFWNGCENVTVENCWVYQIYDSGLSHQGNGNFLAKNITFSGNLIEYTSFASIEYWANKRDQNSMINITYRDNILRFAGYGWGELGRPNHQACHILATGSMDQLCVNFVIENNILDTALNNLISCIHLAGTLPKLSGNTYIQSNGDKYLGRYGKTDSEFRYALDENSENILKNKFKEESPKVILIE